MSVCKSCGAEILFVRMASGKAMPVDAEPHPEGNVRLADGVATVVKARGGSELLHRSHFATCPAAAKHRTRS